MRSHALWGALLAAASVLAAPAGAQTAANQPAAAPAASVVADAGLCAAAVATAERSAGLPARLLAAIAVVESGRLVGSRVVAWPWTINAGGAGRYFDTKAEAVAAVRLLQASGVRSIDVGCAQVNLMHHPVAFASLEDAFDPVANTGYAARFLASLFRASQSWPLAAAAYHSQTRDLAAHYLRKVSVAWPGAAAHGAEAAVLLLAGPSPAALPSGSVPGVAPGVAAAVARIDPRGIYTPEFARELALDAAFRARRDAALRGGRRLPQGGLLQAGPGRVPDQAARRVLAGQQDEGTSWPRRAAPRRVRS